MMVFLISERRTINKDTHNISDEFKSLFVCVEA